MTERTSDHRDAAKRSAHEAFLGQVVRYLAVGGFATCAHFAVLILCVEALRLPALAGSAAGAVCGAVIAYILNRRYTFDATPHFARGLALYLGFATGGLLLNLLIMKGLMLAKTPYLLAQTGATALLAVWNFSTARLVVFRNRG